MRHKVLSPLFLIRVGSVALLLLLPQSDSYPELFALVYATVGRSQSLLLYLQHRVYLLLPRAHFPTFLTAIDLFANSLDRAHLYLKPVEFRLEMYPRFPLLNCVNNPICILV